MRRRRNDGAGGGRKADGLNRFYASPVSRRHGKRPLLAYPTLEFLASGAIVVDAQARRFVDEGYGGTHIANAVAALPDPLGTTIIFDSAIWEGPGREYELPPNPHVIDAGARMIAAPTIPELAGKIGVPADALQRTVSEYNARLAAGALDKLTPRRSVHAYKPWPIVKPPFLAMEMCAGLTYTMGGIATDAQGRVLREDGSPIAGLFAEIGHRRTGKAGNHRYTGGLSKASSSAGGRRMRRSLDQGRGFDFMKGPEYSVSSFKFQVSSFTFQVSVFRF